MANPTWEDDGNGENGHPSSLQVLLRWLEVPGNAMRWLESAGRSNGSRLKLAYEVYDQLLVHGINYRSVGAISARLWMLEHQLMDAEQWLQSRGLCHYGDSKEAELEVLRLCPYYAVIKPLFRPNGPAATAVSHGSSASAVTGPKSSDSNTETFQDINYPHTEDEAIPNCKVSSKRVPTSSWYDDDTKRTRVEQASKEVKRDGRKCVTLLKAEPDERREFFKLELQVKRDEAILVRARARKELLDMGIHLIDVNRLLPL